MQCVCTQCLTVIQYINWDDFVSRRDDASITGSTETDVKTFGWLKHKVIHNVDVHWKTGNGSRELKYHWWIEFDVVICN